MNRQESHRIYLQLFAPDPTSKASDSATLHWQGSHGAQPSKYPNGTSRNRFVRQPSTTVTTSAAVRLTDKARAKDVTALLRGKFGLPQISSGNTNQKRENLSNHYSTIPTRLSQVQKDGSNRYGVSQGGGNIAMNALEATNEDDDEIDALVLIGTIERPPKGYLRFEHEEFQEENLRLEKFRQFQCQQQGREPEKLPGADALPTETELSHLHLSESANSIQVSGALPGGTSSLLQANSAFGVDANMNLIESVPGMISSAGVVGLDSSHEDLGFSSSRRKLTPLVSELSVAPNHSPPIVDHVLAPPQSRATSPVSSYEYDLEPLHIVRTVLPDEHPLLIRDEVMTFLAELRQEAEDEMGFRLIGEREGDFHGQYPQPTFRWFFQPCSPLGGNGSGYSPKIQCIPAYVDIEGYCTEEESESDHDENNDLGIDEVGKEGIIDVSGGVENSRMRRQLIEERRRIAFLRDLTDPPFIVSGHLLKQSWRDPYVWRRVYCVLSEDRMWTIGRMKPLKNFGASSNDILSYLRTGRHRYFMLHRSQLLERGEGALVRHQSSSKYNGYYLTPLNQRLPNSFRVITSQGKCHSFRAFTSQSFRLWVTSISERITQKLEDGIMDLANLIAEEETTARCRRMDNVAVSPLELHNHTSTESKSISMDVVRFGIAVSAFRELCRHVIDTIRQYSPVNAQTRVGTSGTRSASLNVEHEGMISSAWEDARVVASKSAQIIHALSTMQHDESDKNRSTPMEELVDEQKSLQALLGEHFDNQVNMGGATTEVSCLPSIQFFDPLLKKLQWHCQNEK